VDDRATALTLLVLGAVTAGSGLLLVARRLWLAGAATAVVGLGLLAAVVADAGDRRGPAEQILLVTAMVTMPLALLAYPVLRWRRPAELAAVSIVLGLGVGTVAWWGTEFAATLGIIGGCALFGHVWWRIETAAESERRALQWMALAAAVTGLLGGFALFAAQGDPASPYAFLVVGLVGPAMVVGVALPEIVDVRGLIVSVVVVTVCVVALTSAYVGVLALLDMAGIADLSPGVLGLLAGLLAMGFHPLRLLLRGTVDEALFGGRRDPLDAASRVAGRVGDDPAQALRAIREALVLPYAALRAAGGLDLAVSGTADSHTRTFALDGVDAELIVGLRPGDLRLTPGDEHVLRLVAPLLAQTLRARSLAADLQASREATITAVEEERRRLRRDLHDGLGPRLSGIAFTSDAARNLVRRDPEAADALLKQLRADTTTAIEDIRRIVYAMRPPALDELGLVPALRQQATGLRTRDDRPLAVRLDVPSRLPPLPAAVEVAAYRIVTEALANVARHSTGTSATVTVRAEPGQLVVDVADDGRGGDPWHAGVGTSSMRERAAELGGSLTAGPARDGGHVRAVLPVLGLGDDSMAPRDQTTP
jgi:signal transduction histidine kinase